LTLKNAITIGVIFGIVAAAVVWWLERFEINKFHGEVHRYMKHQSEFTDFLKEKGIQE
jgi:hypothetical protein